MKRVMPGGPIGFPHVSARCHRCNKWPLQRVGKLRETFPAQRATARLPVQMRRIELSRTGPSGVVDPSLILELLLECELEGVTRLRCCEGMLPAWNAPLFAKLEGLRILNLSSCQLTALPTGMSVSQHALVSLPYNCTNFSFTRFL